MKTILSHNGVRVEAERGDNAIIVTLCPGDRKRMISREMAAALAALVRLALEATDKNGGRLEV